MVKIYSVEVLLKKFLNLLVRIISYKWYTKKDSEKKLFLLIFAEILHICFLGKRVK